MSNLSLEQWKGMVPKSYTGDPVIYLKIVKQMLVGQNLKDEHLLLFMQTATRTGLDPIAKQIYAIARKDWKTGEYNMTIQTAIDGFRLIAQRSGDYGGQDDAVFTEEELFNPVSEDVEKDLKASVTVWKIVNGIRVPVVASARWKQYVQTDKNGQPTNLWKKMPYVMLAKVAEALALRKAFPNDLSGLYASEEMEQADNQGVIQASPPTRTPSSAPTQPQPQVDIQDGLVEQVEVEEKELASDLPWEEPSEPVTTTEPAGAPNAEDDDQARWNTKMQYLYKLMHEVKGDKSLEVQKQEILTKYNVRFINKLTEENFDEIIGELEVQSGVRAA